MISSWDSAFACGDLPAKMRSASGGAWSRSAGEIEPVVDHDVGAREPVAAGQRQQAGVARAGADQRYEAAHRAAPAPGLMPASIIRRAARMSPARAAADAGPFEVAGAHAAGVVGHEGADAQGVARHLRVGADRQAAAGAEASQEGALGVDRDARWRVVDGAQSVEHLGVVRAALHGEDALADGRQHLFRREDLRCALEEAEALQAGDRQHGRVVLAGRDLGDARVDVAADALDAQVGPQRQQLDGAAPAVGADAGAGGQLLPASGRRGRPGRRGRRARGRTAPMTRPSGSRAGMSLRLCTARSISPASRRRSMSLTKTPWPPISSSDTSVRRSPSVCTMTSSIVAPASASMTIST